MGSLFPYEPRKGQMEIVDSLSKIIDRHSHCAVQSGTGTGKTACALTAALSNRDGIGTRVLYLTRTNSQQKQVMSELRAISRKQKVFGLAIQGRRNMCPYIDINEELKSGTHEELSLLCAQKKNKVLNGDSAACKFFHTLITVDPGAVEAWARNNLPTAEEFMGHCSERGMCSYELCKQLLQNATVVTAPYIYFFDPFIRKSLLEWMNCELEDLIVIVDEAHNLPEYARELRTSELSAATLKMAEKEARELRDPEISEGTSTSDILAMLNEILAGAVNEFVLDDDGLVPPGLLEEELMSRLHLTSKGILRIAENLINLGEIVRDKRKMEGRLPRSYLHGVGGFLEFWMTVEEDDYVKLVVSGSNPRLEAYCLDPSIACSGLHQVRSSVHMSGTLEPLEEYRDSIGLPKESETLSFPSPFPRGNLEILYTDDVTSRYEDIEKDKKIIGRMTRYISNITSKFEKNLAVFFPSYSLLERFLENGLLEDFRRPVFKEERGMPQDDLMTIVDNFKKCEEGGLMLAVSGGRISEGIDFPDRELEIAVVAGIPYPKPTARTRALQHYYDLKFGKGWEYVVKASATRKTLQSIGRLLRSETDRGVAVILDKRIIHFKPFINARSTKNPVEDISDFFSGSKTPKIKLSKRKGARQKRTAVSRQDR
ncbi:MAG: ATP-dependent DNA helicase [Thermoplasmata archaeon]|nr:ATP-dependent DNA helicase [Thermoplasmata archaeon]